MVLGHYAPRPLRVAEKMKKIGLLPRILIAIVLGVVCGMFFPDALVRIFVTIKSIFGSFLGFVIPLLIIGLVVPGIANLGNRAGKLLLITVVLAYVFTLFSGLMSMGTCQWALPKIIGEGDLFNIASSSNAYAPYFTIEMIPIMDVMATLIFSFMLGLGIAFCKAEALKRSVNEFSTIITKLIEKVIVPFLPIYIYSIFLEMTAVGQIAPILSVFIKMIILIFIMTVVLLIVQFGIAGIYAGKNPFKQLRTMMPAYFTALGTQSSAATIPVTYERALKCGIREPIAAFVIPLCATIHLSGSVMKIVACSLAIIFMTGMPFDLWQYVGFIFILAVTMVAAPGVPGGAIMAALAPLNSMLGFGETEQGLMIALYIAMDSFGTATNVTGDGSIALIVDKIAGNNIENLASPETTKLDN